MTHDLDRLRLVVHFGEKSQASYSLQLGAYSIGSNSDCSIHLSDPNVEDEHALLTITREEITLENFAAPISLLLSGDPLAGKRSVGVGDSFVLGTYRLSLIESSAAQSSASSDLSTGNPEAVDEIWSQLQRGLPGYDNILSALRSVISPTEAETARRTTFSGLRAFGWAVGVLIFLAIASASLPQSQSLSSVFLFDLASAWTLVGALVLITRYQASFAGRVLLPLLWTLRFLGPPTSDWYELPHATVVLSKLICAALLGSLLDFGASSNPGKPKTLFNHLALVIVGGVELRDCITTTENLTRGFLLLYAAASIICMFWNFWPGPRLEKTKQLSSFDSRVLTVIGVRRWFRLSVGRSVALALGIIPILLFLHSFHIKERLQWPKGADTDPAIRTGGKEAKVWFWKHIGHLLRPSDLQKYPLYGYLDRDMSKADLQQIRSFTEKLGSDPADMHAYQSLQRLLGPCRLSSESQASRILADVEIHPGEQSIYYLERNKILGHGPFWASNDIFSARDQLAFTWPQLKSFTSEEIERRDSNSGLRRFILMVYGFIGVLILWRRGGDWWYAFWLGLWFLGAATIGTYRYNLFFFQTLAYSIWCRALASPGISLLLTIFQSLDILVIVNMVVFASFLSCAAVWSWVCWPTNREYWPQAVTRFWLGRILYIAALVGKLSFVALAMGFSFWGSWLVFSILLESKGLAGALAAIVFVVIGLGAGHRLRKRIGKPMKPIDWGCGFLFLSAQALALLWIPEIPKLPQFSLSSGTAMTLGYSLICGLAVIFLALVVRNNFFHLFTLRNASFVITASIILVTLKFSEGLLEVGVEFLSKATGLPEPGSKILGISVFVLLVPSVHRWIERLLLHLSLVRFRPSLNSMFLLRLRQIEKKVAASLELLLNTQDPKSLDEIRPTLATCEIHEYTFMSRRDQRVFVNSVSCSSSPEPDQIEISEMLLEFFRDHKGAVQFDRLPFEWKFFFVQFELERLQMAKPAKFLIPIRLGESVRGLLFISGTSADLAIAGEPITDSISEVAILTTQLRYQHFTEL